MKNQKEIIDSKNPEDIRSLKDIMANLWNNPRISDMKLKLAGNKILSLDDSIMLQALVFEEFRKNAVKAFKTQTLITLGLLMANIILAITALITVLSRG